MSIGVWGADRADDLVGLFAEAFPAETLSFEEVVACCWDDLGAVLGFDDGECAVSVVARGEHGFVKALAVSPLARGERRGRALLDAGEEWLFDNGCTSIVPGPSAPFYLWPGVDVRWTRALCLFESAGYVPVGANLNMSCPSTFRARPPDGVEVRRVLHAGDVDATLEFCSTHWPEWVAETRRGIDHGAAFAAVDVGRSDGDVIGFACHSVNRTGWLGPMATDPVRQRGGVGSSLLSAICADVAELGRADVEIAWVGPVRFYARAAGAAVSRTFRVMVKPKA